MTPVEIEKYAHMPNRLPKSHTHIVSRPGTRRFNHCTTSGLFQLPIGSTYVMLRMYTFSSFTLGSILGKICTADGPEPMYATLFPFSRASASTGQSYVCYMSPLNDSMPGTSGVTLRL